MAAFVVSEFEALDEGAPAHYQQLAAALIAANGGQLRENLPLSNCTRDWKSSVVSREAWVSGASLETVPDQAPLGNQATCSYLTRPVRL
jgi:hypothetical protein